MSKYPSHWYTVLTMKLRNVASHTLFFSRTVQLIFMFPFLLFCPVRQ